MQYVLYLKKYRNNMTRVAEVIVLLDIVKTIIRKGEQIESEAIII